MSETNPTALPTSTNGANGATATLQRNGLRNMIPFGSKTGARPGERPTPGQPSTPAASVVDGELRDARLQVERDQGHVELQQNTARLDRLSKKELRAERRQAERLRTQRRKLQALQESTAIAQQTSRFKAEAKQAASEQGELVWQTRAKGKRERLMDPTSRLATIYRTQVAASWVLMALAVVGIGWCAYSVGKALGGQWFTYAVEPLFSVPLLVIMVMHARAAQNRTRFPIDAGDRQRRAILALEIGLFVATTLLNVSSVVPGLGQWVNVQTLLVHLCPPALIVIAVMLQPIVSTFLSRLLTEVYIEAGVDSKRLSADENNLLARVKTIHTLWESNSLRSANPNDPHDRTAGPSVKAVQEALGLRKELCQAGVDGWWKLFGPAETQQIRA